MFMEGEQDLDLATEVRSRCRRHPKLRSQSWHLASSSDSRESWKAPPDAQVPEILHRLPGILQHLQHLHRLQFAQCIQLLRRCQHRS